MLPIPIHDALTHVHPFARELATLIAQIFVYVVDVILVPIIVAIRESKAAKSVVILWYLPYLIPLLTALVTLCIEIIRLRK
jgi:hypothetical protein